MILPKLIKSKDGLEGYELKALNTWMKRKGMIDRWSKWFIGQTGTIIDGKLIVYKHDVDRFLQGLEPFD